MSAKPPVRQTYFLQTSFERPLDTVHGLSAKPVSEALRGGIGALQDGSMRLPSATCST